jgi:hypothetical protein
MQSEAKMRVVLVRPAYHSGGAEIAGDWPPAWVAYLSGHLKDAGFADITFIDAMTNNHLTDDQIRAWLIELRPDVVGTTAITRARQHPRHLHLQAGAFGGSLIDVIVMPSTQKAAFAAMSSNN